MLGKRLERALEGKKMTQQQLATALGVSQATISYWCRGEKRPNADKLESAAEVLAVNTVWLRDGAGPMVRIDREEQRRDFEKETAWIFRDAPYDRGRDYGNANVWSFNPNIETFVREVLQNARDAARSKDGKVEVTFKLISLKGEPMVDFQRAIKWEKLVEHLRASAQTSQKLGRLLSAALERPTDERGLLLLVIEERGTVGLTGDEYGTGNFAALCRNNLDSQKVGSAGGSYGLGKAVLWRASDFSTVLFCSNLAEPTDGKQRWRVIGRSELTWHSVGEGEYAGPGWFGAESDRRAVSYWNNAALADELHLGRNADLYGTSTCVVGFNDPSSDKEESPRELAEKVEKAAAKYFWPAITDDLLGVSVEIHEAGNKLYRTDVQIERLEPAFAQLLRTYREGGCMNNPVELGDCTVVDVPLTVPEHKSNDREEFIHEAKLVIRRSEGDDQGAFELAMFRGPGMVVQYLRLHNLCLGAWPFHAALLCGSAAGGGGNDEAADEFLRTAEPPSHDRWAATPDLKASYAYGCVKKLAAFELAIKEALRQVVKPRTEDTGDGPVSVKELFRLGDEPLPPKQRPRVVRVTGALDGQGRWKIEARLRVKPDVRGYRITPAAYFVAESGHGTAIKWETLKAVSNCRVDGHTILVEPRKRDVKFEGVTSASSHPVPAANSCLQVEIKHSVKGLQP